MPALRRLTSARVAIAAAVLLAIGAVALATLRGPEQPRTLQERTQEIAAGLRCPVCQNLSVADSPSGLAREMREAIADRLRTGQGPEEIRAYFVDRYGEWILLSPSGEGLGAVAWVAPVVALAVGAVAVTLALRRRRPEGERPVTATERARIARELTRLEEPQ
ncbi:MAG: cytochrome c-type biogenesis protein [Actinomycetota bacterium]